MFDLRMILSAIRHYKVGVLLVILQIALTFAITSNVVSISAELYQKITRSSGMNIHQNIAIESIGNTSDFDPQSTWQTDQEMLRSTPGVTQVSLVSEVPLGPSALVPTVTRNTEKYGELKSRGYGYFTDEFGLEALGLELTSGRNFVASEVGEQNPLAIEQPEGNGAVLVTQEWADMLFPDGDALGGEVNTPYGTMNIVGIIKRMQGAWADWEGFQRVMLFPGRMIGNRMSYVVSTDGNNREALIRQIEDALYQNDSGRVISTIKGQNEFLDEQYQNHTAMLSTLLIISALLFAIAAFGIYALTKFNISRQTRQIGIKRALGATKHTVVSLYLLENFIVTTVALLLGLIGIVFLNDYLVSSYQISSINWTYVPFVLVSYLIIGLVAVYFPAIKAASESPVAAIRAS